MPSRLEIKLAKFLKDKGFGVLEPGTIERTYAGEAQRCCGAWGWFAKVTSAEELTVDVGSQYPLGELMADPDHLETSYEHGSLVLDPTNDHKKMVKYRERGEK